MPKKIQWHKNIHRIQLKGKAAGFLNRDEVRIVLQRAEKWKCCIFNQHSTQKASSSNFLHYNVSECNGVWN